MGAGQSTSGGDGSGAAQEVKTSYYELLGVHRQATDDELKKAYRRKALELHPDRNYGNEEAATKTFAEVQTAYEVLSDPQERAWYDSHESAILRGDDAVGEGDAPTFENVRITTADDLTRIVRKFNSNVEFSDAPSGFFGFVRETFDQLIKEEEIAANWENVELHEYPSFGHKDDEYGDVVKRFYAAWSGFSTVKSFSWKDKYRLSEAPDRWYRRRMEQENNHLRQDAKREFNEAVRSLVAFIRKRDPRYVPSTQTEAERQKVLRDAAAAQAARARAANMANIQATDEPEWTKVREPEELEESDEEPEEQEVFECVACNKVFKSERQWEAHEKSKKHQKSVRSLQQRMRKQNTNLDLDGSNDENSGIATPDAAEFDDEVVIVDDVSDVGTHEVQINGHSGKGDASDEDENNEKRRDDHDVEANSKTDLDEHGGEELPSATKGQPSDDRAEASNSENEDYASLETIQSRIKSVTLNTPTDSDDETQPTKPKMGKAAQKRAKKAAAAAASQQNDAEHKCEVCNATYPSKTKLFQHIKDEGHAALKSASGGGSKGKKGKGKR